MSVVLVVDSDGDVVRSVSEAFVEKRGLYAVIERRSGLAAMIALKNGIGVDIAVVDDKLVDMDGMDFLVSVKRLAPELPVIMMSGHPSVEAYLKAVNAGVFEFITRPISPPLLRKIMSAALEETALSKASFQAASD